MKALVFLVFIILVLQPVQAGIDQTHENPEGITDKTVIWRSDLKEVGDNYQITVNIVSRDNNREGDGDGGKIEFENAKIIDVVDDKLELDCLNDQSFSFECYFFNNTFSEEGTNSVIQWFNFVFSEFVEDEIQVLLEVPKNKTSLMCLMPSQPPAPSQVLPLTKCPFLMMKTEKRYSKKLPLRSRGIRQWL